MIGSLRAYLSRNWRAITYSCRCPITGVRFEKVQIEQHVIGYPITCALMASLAMFSAVFKT